MAALEGLLDRHGGGLAGAVAIAIPPIAQRAGMKPALNPEVTG
jgi:hypothetical protein